MARACQEASGGMLALLGATLNQAHQIAQEASCFVANDNAPGQIVLSGTLESLEHAEKIVRKMQIKRAGPLQVAGAFHSPLMQRAADEMSSVLSSTKFDTPKIPVCFNVTAKQDNNIKNYPNLLTKQITAPVRWCELIQNMNQTVFVECGVGGVLCGLIRRILPDANAICLGSSDGIKNFLRDESR